MRLYLGRKFYLELALPQWPTRNSELRKNTKQNATKIPNTLQNPQETSIYAASLYSKQYGISQKGYR